MDLICYLSNGYPTIESSKAMAKTYIDSGCDIIEIDFPSTNPYLEGEFIANRMKVALENCHDYSKYMNAMVEIKKEHPTTAFILLVYENTIEDIGINEFIVFCKENNFLDIILCGIKDETIKNKLIVNDLKVSCYVQFKMDRTEIDYARNSNGFVYMQAVVSKEEDINPKFPTLKDCIGYLRKIGITRPIYCGVGIHNTEKAIMAKKSGANAIFVGSSILKLHDDIPALEAKIKEFKQACK